MLPQDKSIQRVGNVCKTSDAADRTDTGNAGDQEDTAADEPDQRQYKACGLHSANETGLLCIAGQNQANDTQNNRSNQRLTEEPADNRNDAKYHTGGCGTLAGNILVFHKFLSSI